MGVVAYYSNPNIHHSTIRDNAQAGIWLFDAEADDFYQTVITHNSIGSSQQRGGIEVLGGSDIFLFPAASGGNGLNRISNNAYTGILVEPDASNAVVGYVGVSFGGSDSILPGINGDLALDNNASFTLQAEETYWGAGAPSDHSDGPIDYGSNYLTSDPTGSSGYDGPSSMQSTKTGASTQLILASSGKTASTATQTQSLEAYHISSFNPEFLRPRIRTLRQRLQAHPVSPGNDLILRQLYNLQEADRRNTLQERGSTLELISNWAGRLKSKDINGGLSPRQQTAVQRGAEAAATLVIRDALIHDRYEDPID